MLRVNPGGVLAPDQVWGRETLIERLWTKLERQSLVLTAERRMGKTSILTLMEVQARGEWVAVYRDLEQVHSLAEFVELLWQDVETHLRRWRRRSPPPWTIARSSSTGSSTP